MTFFDGEWFLTKIGSLRSVSCARFSLLKDFHQTLHTCIKAWCVQLVLLVLFTTRVSLNAHSQELCRCNKSQWHHNEGKADDSWHVSLGLYSSWRHQRKGGGGCYFRLISSHTLTYMLHQCARALLNSVTWCLRHWFVYQRCECENKNTCFVRANEIFLQILYAIVLVCVQVGGLIITISYLQTLCMIKSTVFAIT